MNMLEVIGLCFINLLSFWIGARVGQNKSINPVSIVKESKIKKEVDLKDKQLKTTLDNIDRYDGTGFGQQQIPR